MNLLDLTGSDNTGQNTTATLPTLEEALFQQKVRAADNWIEAMVLSALKSPKAEIIELTPSLASALLGRNTCNRKFRDSVAERYARDIENDRFPFNGASVVVSRAGVLLDGQHRCKAVLDSNMPIVVVIVFGAEDESRLTMDQGATRTSGDYLGLAGYKDPVALAAAGAMLSMYLSYGLIAGGQMRPTKGEIQDVVDAHPGLVTSLGLMHTKNAPLVGGRPVLAFCHYAIGLKSGRRAEVTEYMLQLVNGEGLLRNGAASYVRNRLIGERGRVYAGVRSELIFRGWNLWIRGLPVSRIPLQGGKLPDLEK